MAVDVRPLAYTRTDAETTGFGGRMRPTGDRCVGHRAMGGIALADIVKLNDALLLAAALGLPCK